MGKSRNVSDMSILNEGVCVRFSMEERCIRCTGRYQEKDVTVCI